jgi:hypothetical protein
MMIFCLVFKLEISYNRVVISPRIWFSFSGVFLKVIYFCMVNYLSFYNSSSFALTYLFNVNGKLTV